MTVYGCFQERKALKMSKSALDADSAQVLATIRGLL